MSGSLIDRFGHWLGTWQGTSDLEDGTNGVVEVTLREHFDGNLIEVEARSWQADSGSLRTHGIGFWAQQRNGQVANAMWTDKLGFCRLEETPDDPDVLSLHGVLAGNLTFSATFRYEDDAILFSSRVGEGYAAKGARPRTVATLRRIGLKPLERDHE